MLYPDNEIIQEIVDDIYHSLKGKISDQQKIYDVVECLFAYGYFTDQCNDLRNEILEVRKFIGAKRDHRPLIECLEEWANPIMEEVNKQFHNVEDVILIGELRKENEYFKRELQKAKDALDLRTTCYEQLIKAGQEIEELKAARIAYASEFTPDKNGNPDVDSVHENIRLMKAKLEKIENDKGKLVRTTLEEIE